MFRTRPGFKIIPLYTVNETVPLTISLQNSVGRVVAHSNYDHKPIPSLILFIDWINANCCATRKSREEIHATRDEHCLKKKQNKKQKKTISGSLEGS